MKMGFYGKNSTAGGDNDVAGYFFSAAIKKINSLNCKINSFGGFC